MMPTWPIELCFVCKEPVDIADGGLLDDEGAAYHEPCFVKYLNACAGLWAQDHDVTMSPYMVNGKTWTGKLEAP
ncbi:MAG: hypothetical protein V3W28_04295 [Thermoplasmata archaeon]